MRTFFCIKILTIILFGMLILDLDSHAQKVNVLPERVYITSLADDGQYIWATTDVGLMRLNKQSKATKFFNTQNSALPVNWLYAIVTDESGAKWIGSNKGLVYYNDKEWIIYNAENSGLPDNDVLDVEVDHDDKVWLITAAEHLVNFDGKVWNVQELSKQGVDSLKMLAIGSSEIYIGTHHKGLFSFQNNTVQKKELTGIEDTRINTLEVSPEGKLWIGMPSGLVEYGTEKSIVYKSPYQLPDDNVNAIDFTKSGAVWIGTSTGLVKHANNGWQFFDRKNSGLDERNILSLEAGDENIHYLGTPDGLVVFTDSTGRPGNSIIFSYECIGEHTRTTINYEKILMNRALFLIASGIGIGTESEWDRIQFYIDPPEKSRQHKPYGVIPAYVSFLFGKRVAFLELGLEGSFLSGVNDPPYRIESIVGLRLQPRRFGKVLFRINIQNGFIGEPADFLGLSLGATF